MNLCMQIILGNRMYFCSKNMKLLFYNSLGFPKCSHFVETYFVFWVSTSLVKQRKETWWC